jgi:hypothetical protein
MADQGSAWRDPRIALVCVVAFGLWFPLTGLDWFWGHEQASYILRTVEWASELRAGVLYPRWCPDFYGGYGSPLFMFYGPVIYGVAGLLTATFTSVLWGLKVVVLLGSLCSGLGAYALVLGETRDRDAALLGAMAFLAAPYRIGNVYDRGDLGEFSCLAVLPVVLAVYRASGFEARPERARRLAVTAALLHALLIMTHPVLGMWGSLVIGVTVAVTAVKLFVRGARRRAAELVFVLAAAPCLAGLYIVPALVDRKETHTANMVINFYNPQNHWLTLGTLFEPSTPLFLRNFMMIGPLVVLAIAFAGVGAALDRASRPAAFGWLALCGALLALNLPQMSWFWAPRRLPLVTFIQFPWRLIGPAALAACVALGVGMTGACRKLSQPARATIAVLGSAALMFGLAWRYVSTTEMHTEGVPRDPNSVRQSMVSATDANEYLPRAAHNAPGAQARELVEKAKEAEVAYAHQDGSQQSLTVRAKRDGAQLTLALHSFPGWQVKTLEGPGRVTLDHDERGLVRLVFPNPGRYRVHVWFGASLATRGGYALTLATLFALALLLAPRPTLRRWRAMFTARLTLTRPV